MKWSILSGFPDIWFRIFTMIWIMRKSKKRKGKLMPGFSSLSITIVVLFLKSIPVLINFFYNGFHQYEQFKLGIRTQSTNCNSIVDCVRSGTIMVRSSIPFDWDHLGIPNESQILFLFKGIIMGNFWKD